MAMLNNQMVKHQKAMSSANMATPYLAYLFE